MFTKLRHVWKFVKMYSHKAVDTFDQFLYNYVLDYVAPNVTKNNAYSFIYFKRWKYYWI